MRLMAENFQSQADAALAAGQIAEAITWLERALVDAPGDFSALIKLASLRRRLGDLAGALTATNAALDLRANDFLALLFKASLHEQQREFARAAEIYRAALFHAQDLPSPLPPPIAAQLRHAETFLADYRAATVANITQLSRLGSEHRARAERFFENVLDRRDVFHQEPTHYRYPGLPDIEFFDRAYPGLRDRLRAATPAIRAEYDALKAHHAERMTPYVDFASGQPTAQWTELNRSPKWNALHLIRYGAADPINAAACPQTLAALAGEDQPDIAGLTPNVMFSLLAPTTRIPPHHGVANFRAVLHLPLIVPPGCGFRVGADRREWIEGEPWIFDDTIEHEAWNESQALRVILIADLWRPELDEPERELIRQFMAGQDNAASLGTL